MAQFAQFSSFCFVEYLGVAKALEKRYQIFEEMLDILMPTDLRTIWFQMTQPRAVLYAA